MNKKKNKVSEKSWVDPSIYIDEIFVSEEVVDFEITQKIIARSSLQPQVISQSQLSDFPYEFKNKEHSAKKALVLCNNRGTFIKPCPGTQEYLCCDYTILNTGLNCPMDCTYCILQSYLTQPWLTVFVNWNDLVQELNDYLSASVKPFHRIGTGEFTDSLALERFTGFGAFLCSEISKHQNCILELKTKSGFIESFHDVKHMGKTILSWSLNSEAIIKKEEIRSATLDERIAAAKKATELGYPVAFHFDPIIHHEGWEKGYESTINKLFAVVPKESIVWISLGALRFMPSLKNISTSKFPHSTLFYDEFITGLDGKSRYFRPCRVKLYKYIYERLMNYISSDTCVYFCMESDEIWNEVTGYIPTNRGGIGSMLDSAAKKALAKY